VNTFLDFKNKMFTMNTFRCDLFEKSGAACDPKGLTCRTLTTTTTEAPPQFGRRLAAHSFGRRLSNLCSGTWCLDADGKAKTKTKTCTLAEFETYVSDYHGRLEKLIKVVDNVAGAYHPGVKDSIEILLTTNGGAAKRIANSVTCNFIAEYYEDFIDGACYQGIWGARRIAKSYVWTTVLTGFLVITMYAVYCRSKSNHKYWQPDRTRYKEIEAARLNPKNNNNNPEDGQMLLGGREVQAPTQMGPPKTKYSEEGAAAGNDAGDEF